MKARTSLALFPLVALLAVTPVPAAGPAQALPKTGGTFEVEVTKDVAYCDGKDADPVRHRLDLYLPKGHKDYPVLLFIHGGGWRSGDKSKFDKLGETFARHGVGTVIAGYRLTPQVQHPAHVQDVARAFAWTHRHIGKHGGRPDQIFVSGHSAGGHLVALLATDESYLKAEKLSLQAIKGAIPISGVYEITPGRWGGVFPREADGRREASPLHHVRENLPPFLILYGERDSQGFEQMAEDFCQALRKNKCAAASLKVKDRTHGSIVGNISNPDDAATQAMLAFIGKHSGQGLSAAAPAAEPFRKTLISSTRHIQVATWETSSKEATPNCPVAWSVRKATLHGGKQEGVEVITVDNGKLRFTVIPTRGMGVASVTLGDVRLGWDSPVKELVHPQWVNLQGRGGLGWLEGFNEHLCRCGLESNGHPGTDKFINNVGDEATMELTLHGRVANLPAQEVEVTVEREPPYRIRVRGRVDERMFYGPKLELQTEISTEPGASTFRIADTLTNQGAQPQEFQLLYHVNYGRPLLEAGSTFVAPAQRVTPFNDHAAQEVKTYDRYAGPQLGFVEQVYCLRLFGDKDDRTLLLLQNQAKDRAVSIAYSIKELPYLTQWKNTAAEKDGYVTGLEPGTNFPHNRRVEREHGRVPKLAPGASRHFAIDFGIHTGKEDVRGVADKIAALRKGREAVLDSQPEKEASSK